MVGWSGPKRVDLVTRVAGTERMARIPESVSESSQSGVLLYRTVPVVEG